MLVTGAAGFLGARVVALALERGHPVTALVSPTSTLERLEPVLERIQLERADIADGGALREVAGRARPDVAVHLAAAGAVVADTDIRRLLNANALAPLLLAEALADAGCRRLVTAGSSSEYGPMAVAMDEAMAPDPDDLYGVAKLAGGLFARVAGARKGLETAHMRLFSIYGPGEDHRRLVAGVIGALLAGRPMELSPGEQVRDFVYVDDAADALLQAALEPGIDGVTLNVGSGIETTVRDMCLLVAEQVGGHELLRFGARPYRPAERFHWRAATARTAQVLGWRATTPLAEGISRTIAAMRAEAAA